jgi:hypothetical protein
MKAGAGQEYDKYIGYFKDFMKSFNSPDYSIELGQPKAFTNSDIKDKAWIFDAKAQPLPSKNLSPLQGQFIYIVSNKSFYYFSVLTTQSSWQSSGSLWQQVNSSLKISP